jgi:uncharacterized protein (TIGR00106 family)
MKVLIDLSVVPIGVGVSVSRYVAECEKIIRASGLECSLHAFGTNIGGDWDEVFAVIKRCHERLHEMGVVRIHSTIRLGTRTDRDQSLNDKVTSVEKKLGEA